tara:strand:+ start:1318 stop:1707 length:390 start_codon:yes stop_codon:yes gene_type:complete
MKSSKEVIKLGERALTTELGFRDAVHVPVIYAKAHDALRRGDWVGVKNNQTTADDVVGVIDPFLTNIALPGDIVAILLKPNSATNVKHVWEHPLIDGPSIVCSESTAADEIFEPEWDEDEDEDDCCRDC